MNTNLWNKAYLRYICAAGLLTIGCSAASEGPATKGGEKGGDGEGKVYSVDDELHLSATINDPVLAGWWKFNESLLTTQSLFDSSMNDNLAFRGSTFGVDANDPTRSDIQSAFPLDTGLTPRSLMFAGTPPAHDFATVLSTEGDFAKLEPEKISVETWIKTTMSGTGYIISKGAAAGCSAGSYALYVTGGQVKFYVQTPTSLFRESPGSSLVKNVLDGTWHQVIGTFDGTMVRLYVDGVQAGTGTTGAAESIKYNLGKHNNLYFGAYNDDPTLAQTGCQLPFTGAMDNVRIYKNALNAAEAARRYANLELLPRDDDGDGVPNNHDECPSTAPGTQVNTLGCPIGGGLDKDSDGVSNLIDRCDADTTQAMPVAADGCHDGDGDGVSDEPRDGTGVIRDVCPVGTFGVRSARGCSCPQVRTIVNGTFTPDPASVEIESEPCPTTGVCYRNHGAYVSCVDHMIEELLEKRVVRFACAEAIQEQASQSNIGKRGTPTHCPED